MATIDGVYRSQRLRLMSTVAAATAQAWAQGYRDREQVIQQVLTIVHAGQGQTVALVDAYMAAKAQSPAKGLDPTSYTVALLRGVPGEEVYGRPFGALGGQLAQGAERAVALRSGVDALARLVRTDMQLAQTHSARDWMTGEDRIVGYRRVLGGGKNCDLCVAAADRTYRTEDLMPIHERCSCTVEPVFGTEPVASAGTSVRVDVDPELGPRLMADSWSPTGPRLL
jgi:hypothetical protein